MGALPSSYSRMKEVLISHFLPQRRRFGQGDALPAPGGGPLRVGLLVPRVPAAGSAASVQVGSDPRAQREGLLMKTPSDPGGGGGGASEISRGLTSDVGEGGLTEEDWNGLQRLLAALFPFSSPRRDSIPAEKGGWGGWGGSNHHVLFREPHV